MEEHFEGIGQGEFSAVVPQDFVTDRSGADCPGSNVNHCERSLKRDIKLDVQFVSNLVLRICRTKDDRSLIFISNLATVFSEILDTIQSRHVVGATDSQTFHEFAVKLKQLIHELDYELKSYDQLGELFCGINDPSSLQTANRDRPNLQISRVSSANHDSTETSHSCSSGERLRAEKDEALHRIKWLKDKISTLSMQLKEAMEDNHRVHKESECFEEKIVKLNNLYRRTKSELDKEIELKTQEEERCTDVEAHLNLRNKDIAALKEKVRSKELALGELQTTLNEMYSNFEHLTKANERLRYTLEEERERSAFLERVSFEIQNKSTGSSSRTHSEQQPNSDYGELQSHIQMDASPNSGDNYMNHYDYEAEDDDVLECIRNSTIPRTKCTSSRDDDSETSPRRREDVDYTDGMRQLPCAAAEEYDDVLVEDTESLVYAVNERRQFCICRNSYIIILCLLVLVGLLTIICYTEVLKEIDPISVVRWVRNSLEFCYVDKELGRRVQAPQ